MTKMRLIFIGIIFVGSNMFFWDFKSKELHNGTGMPPLQRPNTNGIFTSSTNDAIVVTTVACGRQSMEDAIVLLKSAILSGMYHGYPVPEFIIFTETDDMGEMERKVGQLKSKQNQYHLRYRILSVQFPVGNTVDWKKLFRPCSSQRLFLPNMLPDINEILYLDADTIVLGDLRMIWSKFQDMNSSQMVGMVAEEELSSTGVGRNVYKKLGKFPYFPPHGLNAGVILMNLTRLRRNSSLNWMKAITDAYDEYGDNSTYDQELINIVLHYKPEAVYVLPCAFNYRTDHCYFGPHCKSAQIPPGIQLMHGNDNSFHKFDSFPWFYRVYEYFAQFEMEKDDYARDIIQPLKITEDVTLKNKNSHCNKITNFIFNIE